ncbi:hypothetical protein SAMN06265360_101141 [Haloechinothrix alba]|uniref:Uncharacterized protein n=1 Tax=Haloechinothrix alba TaxID=664784 RepID=A0A238V1N3_9PSEU|nr:hypothetical protein SAMN06265360_101141 [Haloechinothrix alba]
MDLLLVFQDQVDDLPGLTWSEGPTTDGAFGILRVLGRSVPRCELEDLEHLHESIQRFIRQRGDLLTDVSVRNESVQLRGPPLLDRVS